MTLDNNTTCELCGQTGAVKETMAGLICPTCCNLANHIAERPELMKTFAVLAGTGQEDLQRIAQEMPDVLDGIRYRTADRDRNTWYVSVSELDGHPVEIFASSAFENEHQLQSRLSNLTSITRLISLILRHIFLGERLSLNKVLTQLQRSSRQPNDIPEMLAKILANYDDRGQKQKGSHDGEEDFIIP